MDTLHQVLRSIRHDTKAQPDHLSVFREFLGHLDRIGRQAAKRLPPKRKTAKRRAKN